MPRRVRARLTREGLLYLAVLLLLLGAGLLRDVNVLTIIAGLMAGPLVVNWIVARRALRGVTASRSLPQTICAGDLLVAGVELTNSRRRGASWLLVVDDTIQRLLDSVPDEFEQVSVLFTHTPPGASRQTAYRGRLIERGRYRVGPLRISTRFPLGLVRAWRDIDDSRTVLVCPRVGRLTRVWHAMLRTTGPGGGPSRRRGVMEHEFHSLRDWQQGDSRKWIHWRTSARRGALVVRQFNEQQNEDLVLLVDLWAPSRPGHADADRAERVVRFAATIAAELCRRGGSRLSVAVAARRPVSLRGTASRAMLHEIMQALAEVEACSDADVADLVRRACRDAPPGSRTLLVSTRPSGGVAGGLDLPPDAAWIDADGDAMPRFYLDDGDDDAFNPQPGVDGHALGGQKIRLPR